MNALPGTRGLRWLLLAAASLSAIALFLLATATANTGLFAQGYDVLLIGNAVAAAAAIVKGSGMIGAWREFVESAALVQPLLVLSVLALAALVEAGLVDREDTELF